MSIRGTIAVDVAFTDSTTTAGGSSLNTITLRDATEYTTGTAGTASASVAISPTTYKDAAGNAVSFSAVNHFAFSATGSPCRCQQDYLTVESVDGLACVSGGVAVDDFVISTTAGTASFTLVIYGA